MRVVGSFLLAVILSGTAWAQEAAQQSPNAREAMLQRMRMNVNSMRSTIATIRDVPTRQALEANVALWEDFLRSMEAESKEKQARQPEKNDRGGKAQK